MLAVTVIMRRRLCAFAPTKCAFKRFPSPVVWSWTYLRRDHD